MKEKSVFCWWLINNNNWYFHEMFTAVIHHIYQALLCPSLHPAELVLQLLYAVVAQTCAAVSRSIRASSLTSSRREYRLGVLLCRNSLSSLESLGCRAAFSWACWYASSARRTTSWTSWLRPWERGCWGSALRWGLLLMISRFRRSAWQCVEWTEIRICREQRTQMSQYSSILSVKWIKHIQETGTSTHLHLWKNSSFREYVNFPILV